jgi:serine/threonine protein kinase
MTDAFIEAFLATFDDSRFPEDFLQRYELIECLSQNEMGETLLVRDRQSGEHYVAKCYSDQSPRSRTTESSLLKPLHHKGLPAYVGEHQNEKMCCIVREFAPGKSLDRLVQERPLAWQQSVAIVEQLCEILIYLHGQTPPIIHRDIKPQNIIVDEQGNITLIDFGISRTYDENAQEDTLCLGTRHYAAPEQYGFAQTDCRSDIYALGVLLCWLLTGKDDVQYAVKGIPNRWLTNIVEKCTAFAPKDRYKNAAQVRDALTGRTTRRRILSSLFIALVILAAALIFTHSPGVQPQKPAGVVFKEPLVEQAVRLALKKPAPDPISEQELLSVTELYVFGDTVAADENAFHALVGRFVNNDGTVQRGSIQVLDDLVLLKNLRKVSLCYQNIVDVTPLTKLIYLENVDLHHNPIQDVSPLSQLPMLSSLTIFDTLVSDLTALHSCTRLSTVDAGYTQIKSIAALEGLDSLRTLVIRKAPLQSLQGIKNLPMLEQVYLSETQLQDLTPLLDLPRLQLVEVDETMRPTADAIAEKARFKIVYP